MAIHTNPVSLSISDYCNAYNRKEIQIDRRYQRSAGIWPDRAQSYLIETIIRGFPIPKLAVHSQTDIKSRRTIKWVVDGQQRTLAIVNFFNGDLRLSRSLELPGAGGRTFDELPEELQAAFISYLLQFDQFEATGEETVREYFRRINSFSAPLNPEEKRNADFQGNMKWIILRLTGRHSETLIALETLTEREVIRMADDKLLAEVIHALLNGVKTTTASLLNAMYRAYERKEIEEERKIERAIDDAFNQILEWSSLRMTPLVTRTHVFYSLLLAVIAVKAQWSTLQTTIADAAGKQLHVNAERNLLELAEAVAASDPSEFKDFVAASSEKTNTSDQRAMRVKWLAAALTQSSLK